jgi:hypothetical protein
MVSSYMRPVAMQGDPAVFGGTFWFFADDRSRKVGEIEAHPQVSRGTRRPPLDADSLRRQQWSFLGKSRRNASSPGCFHEVCLDWPGRAKGKRRNDGTMNVLSRA